MVEMTSQPIDLSWTQHLPFRAQLQDSLVEAEIKARDVVPDLLLRRVGRAAGPRLRVRREEAGVLPALHRRGIERPEHLATRDGGHAGELSHGTTCLGERICIIAFWGACLVLPVVYARQPMYDHM